MESRSNRVVRRPRTIEGRAEGKPVQESKVIKSRVTESRPSQVIRRPRTQVVQTQTKETRSFLPVLESLGQFPDEIKINILNGMDCQELRKAKLNPEFSRLITRNMLDKAINRGYPRASGKAKVHRINISDREELKPYYQILNAKISTLDKNSFSNKLDNIVNEYDSNELREFVKKLKEIYERKDMRHLSRTIDWKLIDKFGEYIILNLVKINDLVKGDIIVDDIGEGKLGYDGCNFIRNDKSGKFKVLENNVPIDYWLDHEGNSIGEYVGFGTIDVNPYLNQILNKLKKAGSVDTKAKINIDGEEYTIFFRQGGYDDVDSAKNEIKAKINEGKLGIIHKYDSIYFYLS
jgi:hypothetical protein